MVFDLDPQAVFERMKTLCLAQGVRGVAPLDNQIGLEGLPPAATCWNASCGPTSR